MSYQKIKLKKLFDKYNLIYEENPIFNKTLFISNNFLWDAWKIYANLFKKALMTSKLNSSALFSIINCNTRFLFSGCNLHFILFSCLLLQRVVILYGSFYNSKLPMILFS